MEYRTSTEAVQRYFLRFDPEIVISNKKFENGINKKIEEDFAVTIKRILQEKLTIAST